MPKYTPERPAIPLPDGTYQINLTKGFSTIVDADDSDLAEYKWKVSSGYARRTITSRYKDTPNASETMHRVIMERILGRKLQSSELVDHADCNPLNNRRSNLRLANKAQNSANSKRRKDNHSGYKGICRFRKRWMARIYVNGKYIHIGMFDTAIEAHEAYCEKAKEYFGEFARFE